MKNLIAGAFSGDLFCVGLVFEIAIVVAIIAIIQSACG